MCPRDQEMWKGAPHNLVRASAQVLQASALRIALAVVLLCTAANAQSPYLFRESPPLPRRCCSPRQVVARGICFRGASRATIAGATASKTTVEGFCGSSEARRAGGSFRLKPYGRLCKKKQGA